MSDRRASYALIGMYIAPPMVTLGVLSVGWLQQRELSEGWRLLFALFATVVLACAAYFFARSAQFESDLSKKTRALNLSLYNSFFFTYLLTISSTALIDYYYQLLGFIEGVNFVRADLLLVLYSSVIAACLLCWSNGVLITALLLALQAFSLISLPRLLPQLGVTINLAGVLSPLLAGSIFIAFACLRPIRRHAGVYSLLLTLGCALCTYGGYSALYYGYTPIHSMLFIAAFGLLIGAIRQRLFLYSAFSLPYLVLSGFWYVERVVSPALVFPVLLLFGGAGVIIFTLINIRMHD